MNEAGRGILLVEDDPDHEELTLYALREHDISDEVTVAHDGAEALDYLLGRGYDVDREPPHVPRVVLLDLKLPKIGGLEVLKRIRGDARTQLLPVVVLTSSDEERDQIESYKYGANSYVRKPVDFVQLSEAVRQLGLYWLKLNDPPPVIDTRENP